MKTTPNFAAILACSVAFYACGSSKDIAEPQETLTENPYVTHKLPTKSVTTYAEYDRTFSIFPHNNTIRRTSINSRMGQDGIRYYFTTIFTGTYDPDTGESLLDHCESEEPGWCDGWSFQPVSLFDIFDTFEGSGLVALSETSFRGINPTDAANLPNGTKTYEGTFRGTYSSLKAATVTTTVDFDNDKLGTEFSFTEGNEAGGTASLKDVVIDGSRFSGGTMSGKKGDGSEFSGGNVTLDGRFFGDNAEELASYMRYSNNIDGINIYGAFDGKR